MNYPLQLSFKTFALDNRGLVTNSRGSVISFVKQKAFRPREAGFNDALQSPPRAVISSAVRIVRRHTRTTAR